MEAVAAVGLASSIITFIDAGSKVIKTAKEIYVSADGASEDARVRETVAHSMRDISAKLQRPGLIERRCLYELAKQCQSLSDEIIAISESTRAIKGGSKREALAAGFRNWTNRGALTQLEERLGHCKRQLGLELQILTSDDAATQLAQLRTVVENDASCVKALTDNIEQLRQSVQAREEDSLGQQTREILQLQEAALRRVHEDRILRGLRFDGKDSRREQIREPQGHTFSWLLDDDDGDDNESDNDDDGDSIPLRDDEQAKRTSRYELVSWLSSGSGIFHISGKLGSGKSTLMRYLYSHARTRAELRAWADGKELMLVGFFFWRPGSSLQNSLSGLYRSIVHDILEACPSLIPDVLPDYWAAAINCHPSTSHIDIPATSIRGALQSLMNHTLLYAKHRLCLFIDGLDELMETEVVDYRALTDLMASWVEDSGGHLKICASSREENAFMNAFSDEQRIRLHHLTEQDMRDYTRDLLGHMRDDHLLARLSVEVAQKACGVFLWAALVVKEIRKEIEAEASEQRLIQRLEQMPEGMDALFQRIIQGLERRDRIRLLRTIAMLNQVKATSIDVWSLRPVFHLEAYSFFDDYEADPSFATLADFDERFLQMESKERRLARAVKQLRKSSGGLLEAVGRDDSLEFTHRSVAEIFEQGPLKTERATVTGDFGVCHAFASLQLAALRLASDTGYRDGKHFHLVVFLLKNYSTDTAALLRYMDSRAEPAKFENIQHPTTLGLTVNEGWLPVAQSLSSRNAGRHEYEHTELPSILAVAALLGHLPFIEWKYTHSAGVVHPIESEAVLILALLQSYESNGQLCDFFFDAGFFDDANKATFYYVLPFGQVLYPIAGDGLSTGQHFLLAHFLKWIYRDSLFYTAKELSLNGYSLEQLLKRGCRTYTSLRITVKGSPGEHSLHFHFLQGPTAFFSHIDRGFDRHWSRDLLRLRAHRYKYFSGAMTDSQDAAIAATLTDSDDCHVDEEYSIRDWFEVSGYPNTQLLLDLLRSEDERRHMETTGEEDKVMESTGLLSTSYGHAALMAFVATMVAGVAMYFYS